MITAQQLHTLSHFSAQGLREALYKSGYTGFQLRDPKFLGLTNGGQFCYSFQFDDGDGEGLQTGKMFLTFDHATGKVSADY